jgi:adenosylcobinamide-GDP ribazoletransferase
MAVVDEVGAAVGSLTLFERLARHAPREALAGGLAFYPLVGLGLGAVAAAVAAAVASVVPSAAAPAGILALVLLTRARGAIGVASLRGATGPLGIVAALALLSARVASLAALPPTSRTVALLVTPMLGTWAAVVQCYGGVPGGVEGPAALVGRARFREFGWASVTALGVTLALGDAVGLVLILAAAAATVALRVHAYRRLGGLTGPLLAATRELVETVVLGTLGVLARLTP